MHPMPVTHPSTSQSFSESKITITYSPYQEGPRLKSECNRGIVASFRRRMPKMQLRTKRRNADSPSKACNPLSMQSASDKQSGKAKVGIECSKMPHVRAIQNATGSIWLPPLCEYAKSGK